MVMINLFTAALHIVIGSRRRAQVSGAECWLVTIVTTLTRTNAPTDSNLEDKALLYKGCLRRCFDIYRCLRMLSPRNTGAIHPLLSLLLGKTQKTTYLRRALLTVRAVFVIRKGQGFCGLGTRESGVSRK